jgi:hypothetical protein
MKWLALFVAALAWPLCAQVAIREAPGRIDVAVDGKPFTALFLGRDAAKPYLHPLRSASGKTITRRWPMEDVAGEERDHPHHTGLWFSHGDVNGISFWPGGAKTESRIALNKVLEATGGPASGTIAALFDWLTPEGKPMLRETKRIVFYSDPKLRTMDFDISLAAVEKATFGDTKEGTFAIRLRTELDEQQPKGILTPKASGEMVNAVGASGEKNVWGKRSPWVDFSGEVEGEKLGVAIFDNPSNPRHPTYWHARAYGLFAANIFGVRDFEADKTKDGSLTLQAGQTLRFRYRVVIHPGGPEEAGIAGLYKEYAARYR